MPKGWVEPYDGASGRVYYARRRIDGEKVTLGQYDTEAEAWRALAAFEAESKSRQSLTLRTWGQRWFKRRENDGFHRGVHKERSCWGMHIDTHPIADIEVKRLERKHVVRFVADLNEKTAVRTTVLKDGTKVLHPTDRRLSRSTKQKALALVKRALSEAADLGYAKSNVALGVTVPKEVATKEKWDWLRVPEYEAIFALPVAPPRKRPKGTISLKQRTAIGTAMYTGVRSGVLRPLRWSQLTLDGRRPELRTGTTKSGKVRSVPLLPPVAAMLKEWRQQCPGIGDALVFDRGDGKPHCEGYDFALPRVLRLAGIDRHFCWHWFRHTCGAHLIQGTWIREEVDGLWRQRPLTLPQIRDWLGHSSVTVTEIYSHLAPDGLHDLANPARRLPGDLDSLNEKT